MILGSFDKQPAEIEMYSIVYSDDLTAGDGVAECTVTVTPPGLIAAHNIVDGQRIRFTVSGGTHGVKYKVTVTVDTDDGRRLQDEFGIKVKEL